MNREKIAVEILRALNELSRGLRANEVQVAATYARMAVEAKLSFGVISPTDALVLEIIGGRPDSNGQFIADRIGMTKSGMSKVLAKLQKKGLIRKKKDKADYKSLLYSLTSVGRKALSFHEKMFAMASREIEALIANRSDKELLLIRAFIADATASLDKISKRLAKANPLP